MRVKNHRRRRRRRHHHHHHHLRSHFGSSHFASRATSARNRDWLFRHVSFLFFFFIANVSCPVVAGKYRVRLGMVEWYSVAAVLLFAVTSAK